MIEIYARRSRASATWEIPADVNQVLLRERLIRIYLGAPTKLMDKQMLLRARPLSTA
jgi:hypothetical protein